MSLRSVNGEYVLSSHCHQGSCVGVAYKSAPCSGGDCVEVGRCDCGEIRVRDSKDPNGPVLVFTEAEWVAFVDGAKGGEFDL